MVKIMKCLPEDEYDVRELHRECDRDYYSIEAYRAIYEMFSECGYDDYDVIAWCCDFDEYDPDYIVEQYGFDIEGYSEMDDDEKLEAVCDELNQHTYAVITGDEILFQCY